MAIERSLELAFFERSADKKLYYEIDGSGDPILLIHGFMGTGSSEFPELRAALAKKYQVIAPDLSGYGQSTPKPRLYGVDFYRNDAEDLVALLEYLNLTRVHVVGYSDGGEIGFWLPILAPDRIRSLVTWGAVGYFDKSIRESILSMLNMRWRTPKTDEMHGAEHIKEMTNRWVASMLGMIDRGGDVTLSRAAQITCPALVILGDRDRLNPAPNGQAIAKAIPKGRFSLYKDTGHSVHLQQPRKFLQEVEQFLKKT